MKKNVNLPTNAQYDYNNIFGARVYHTTKRVYLVDKYGYVVSYSHDEFERIYNHPLTNTSVTSYKR